MSLKDVKIIKNSYSTEKLHWQLEDNDLNYYTNIFEFDKISSKTNLNPHFQ